ncbi:MAG: polysaccharide pyruvyl transferase family protein [Caldilinea sp.]
MRILLDQAVYDMRNKGNIALLQVALERLHCLWPNATLEVMTAAPHLLKYYCPIARPVSSDGRHNWADRHQQLNRVHAAIPDWALRYAFEFREEVRYGRFASVLDKLRARVSSLGTDDDAAAEDGSTVAPIGVQASQESAISAVPKRIHIPDLSQALRSADIVIATGGGFMCDSDKGRALEVMSLLELAASMGKPTFMVGQGIGPVEDPELQAKVRSVLPIIDLILVREARVAPALLEALGVPRDRVLVTGDDAVSLAYDKRSEQLGAAIGVSIRIAHYTGISAAHLESLRDCLHNKATEYHAPLLGIPISCDGHEADQKHISMLLKGYPRASTMQWRFDKPESVIRSVGRCRLVVAGAFHAAVFALAQGVPVVGLIHSSEYAIKFQGLVDQFGAACHLLDVGDPDIVYKLSEAIDNLWQSADRLHPELLAHAQDQISLNRVGYQRLGELVATRISPRVNS